jgi:hypothetical protein
MLSMHHVHPYYSPHVDTLSFIHNYRLFMKQKLEQREKLLPSSLKIWDEDIKPPKNT